jgi:hypothetical protein
MQLKGTNMRLTIQSRILQSQEPASTSLGAISRALRLGILLCALLFISAPRLLASDIIVTFAQGKLNGNAKSFELEINGVNHFLINARADGYTIRKLGTSRGGDFRLEVTKKNGTIADGDKITIKITGLDEAKVQPLAPLWSDDTGRSMGTSENTEVKVKK